MEKKLNQQLEAIIQLETWFVEPWQTMNEQVQQNGMLKGTKAIQLAKFLWVIHRMFFGEAGVPVIWNHQESLKN